MHDGAARPAPQDSRAAALFVRTAARPAVALVGPTASGKSALAHELALVERRRRRDRERRRDVRLSRHGPRRPPSRRAPSAREVPYHLIDLVEPSEEFTVAQFQRAARDATRARLGAPGTACSTSAAPDSTGARCSTTSTSPGSYPEVRAMLEARADDRPRGALRTSSRRSIPLAASRMEPTNARRVVRALEVTLGSGRPFSSYGEGLMTYGPARVVQVGLDVEPRGARRAHRATIPRVDGRRDCSRRSTRLLERPGGLGPHRAPGRGLPPAARAPRRRRGPRGVRRATRSPRVAAWRADSAPGFAATPASSGSSDPMPRPRDW